MEAIILAGGFGTRLSHILKDIPKPMAIINNKPFLYYILSDIVNKGINKIIIAVGYKKEAIIDYFGESFKGVKIVYSEENTPLLTGGAIKQAISSCKEEEVFIINGDTYFDIDFIKMRKFHNNKKSDLTIATKLMFDYDRYGTIIIDEKNKIISFVEKQKTSEGLINGGIYLINKNILKTVSLDKFSFEKDFMENKVHELSIYSFENKSYFIDIGVEEDYNIAREDYIFKKDVFFDE